MPEPVKKKSVSADEMEEQLWAAIAAFEKILEAMPNDRASLEALLHAYEQVGDLTRAKDFLLRLGRVLVEEGDADGVLELAERIVQHADQDPEAAKLFVQIQSLVAAKEGYGAAAGSDTGRGLDESVTAQKSLGFSISDELSFAWNLLESGEISQDDYSRLVEDLTELSVGDRLVTVSLLHVLEARQFKNLERIISNVSKRCETPVVLLSSFDIPGDASKALPLEFSIRRGALVFDFVGTDALVVVLNPFSQQLRKDLESVLRRRCHYYMSFPSEFDLAIEKARVAAAAKPQDTKK